MKYLCPPFESIKNTKWERTSPKALQIITQYRCPLCLSNLLNCHSTSIGPIYDCTKVIQKATVRDKLISFSWFTLRSQKVEFCMPLHLTPTQIFQEKLQSFLGKPINSETSNEGDPKCKQFTGVQFIHLSSFSWSCFLTHLWKCYDFMQISTLFHDQGMTIDARTEMLMWMPFV